jgi:hypothetical protein
MRKLNPVYVNAELYNSDKFLSFPTFQLIVNAHCMAVIQNMLSCIFPPNL